MSASLASLPIIPVLPRGQTEVGQLPGFCPPQLLASYVSRRSCESVLENIDANCAGVPSPVSVAGIADLDGDRGGRIGGGFPGFVHQKNSRSQAGQQGARSAQCDGIEAARREARQGFRGSGKRGARTGTDGRQGDAVGYGDILADWGAAAGGAAAADGERPTRSNPPVRSDTQSCSAAQGDGASAGQTCARRQSERRVCQHAVVYARRCNAQTNGAGGSAAGQTGAGDNARDRT